MEAEKAEAGFETMEMYIWRRQNMVAQYIAMIFLLDLSEATDRKQGSWLGMQ